MNTRVETNIIILRSAADAACWGLSWSFIEDGSSEYGIFGNDGELLLRHYDDDGQPDGWEYEVEEKDY